jgi:hypothetical protein
MIQWLITDFHDVFLFPAFDGFKTIFPPMIPNRINATQ